MVQEHFNQGDPNQPPRTPFVIKSKLVKDAYDGYGRLLLSAGTKIDENLNIDRLTRSDVRYVPAKKHDDDEPVDKPAALDQPAAPSPASKADPAEAARKFVQDFDKKLAAADETRNHATQALTELFGKAKSNSTVDFMLANSAAAPLVDALVNNPKSMLSLVHLKDADAYTLTHSVNVAVLSVALAIKIGVTSDLQELAVGALMHDIGRNQLPAGILDKPGALSDDELTIMRRHPLLGARILMQSGGFSNFALSIVLDHHESMDGHGYPRRRSGAEISTQAKIAAIADVFDALTTDKPYRKSLSPKEAIQVMSTKLKSAFDTSILTKFISMIGYYPVGTTVNLSNGYTAMVMSTNPEDPTRPAIVQMVTDPTGKPLAEPYLVDLRSQKQIDIAQTKNELTPDKVDPVIFREYRPFAAVA